MATFAKTRRHVSRNLRADALALLQPTPLLAPNQWLIHYVSAAASCVLTGPEWKLYNVLRGDTLLILTRLNDDQTFLYVGR